MTFDFSKRDDVRWWMSLYFQLKKRENERNKHSI